MIYMTLINIVAIIHPSIIYIHGDIQANPEGFIGVTTENGHFRSRPSGKFSSWSVTRLTQP